MFTFTRSKNLKKSPRVFMLLIVILGSQLSSGFTGQTQAQPQTAEVFTSVIIASSRFRYEPLLEPFDVQKFLEDRSSGLSTLQFSLRNQSDRLSASQVIEQAALKNDIAPQVILALMQLHSGIIDEQNPTNDQLERPLNLPANVALGFKEQIDWMAKSLDQAAPRYFEEVTRSDAESVILPNGKSIRIPSDKSPSSALVRLTALTTDQEGINHAYGSGRNDFSAIYVNFFSVDPRSFPSELAASLSNARLPFTGTKRYTSGPHGGGTTTSCVQIPVANGSGLDFARNALSDPESFSILTILPGTLLSIDPNVRQGIGNRVRIKHSNSLVSEYWHLASFSAEILSKKKGDAIPQGFLIGMAGQTGGQSAIHLHLELRTPNGTPIPWDGETLDGYQIAMHRVNADATLTTGYNYQGSAVISTTKRLQITAGCGGAGANNVLVGVNYNNSNEQNGVDPNTIFADARHDPFAGHLISTNLGPVAPSTWVHTYGGGDGGTSVTTTTDDGYILSTRCAKVVKFDQSGNILWQKNYSGIGCANNAQSIARTNDGGYIVAGWACSSGPDSCDAWIMKLNGLGDIAWQETYGGSAADYAVSVNPLNDGNYVVAGYTDSYGAGITDGWILKLDGLGGVVWQKTYGGSSIDRVNSIVSTNDGGYVIAGDTFSFGTGFYDSWILKLDGSGGIVWQKTYGASGDHESISSIIQAGDGSLIAAGKTLSQKTGVQNAIVFKLNAAGNLLWQKTYSSESNPYSIVPTNDGGYIIAGDTLSIGAGYYDGWVLKLDGLGSAVWQKTYGGAELDQIFSLIPATGGGYIAVGNTFNFGGGTFVLKLDVNGDAGGSCLIVRSFRPRERNANFVTGNSSATVTTTNVIPIGSNAVANGLALGASTQCGE